MEQRILFDEGRNYLLGKPFIRKIKGLVDYLDFCPMPLDRNKSLLDKVQTIRSTEHYERSETMGLGILSGIFKTTKDVYKLLLDFEGENEKDYDCKYLTGATLELEEEISHFFESGRVIHNTEQIDNIYLDFRMRINLAKELSKKYNLQIVEDSEALYITTGKIENLSELDRLLDLGCDYNEHINSNEFHLRLEELQSLVREGMIKPFLE